MSAPSVPVGLEDALARLEAAVDEFSRVSLTSATDDSALDAWRRVETARRRLDPVEHRIVAEVEQRTLAEKYACRTPAGLARQLLHLHPSEAAGRVAAARHLGPRWATTGEPLEPTYPLVAAALAEGAISSRHARTVTTTLDGLPDQVRAAEGEAVETPLVDFGRAHDPALLGRYAQAVGYYFDQDGRYRDAEERDRKRQVSLRRRPDGSGRFEGELTPECAPWPATRFAPCARPAGW